MSASLHPDELARSNGARSPLRIAPDRYRPAYVGGAPAMPAAARPVIEAITDGPMRNRLLAALPPEDLEQVRPHLERVRLEQRDLLYDPEVPIDYVYFPETAVVSLVSNMSDGGTVEVGTAGCEGMAGLPVFLAEDTSSIQAFTQIPGDTARIETGAFLRLAGPMGELHRILMRYTQAFLTQVAQTAACNGAHLVDERCARWLLMTHDRVKGDEFPLTHEFLAFMLGVRRAGVTVAMRGLQDRQLVRYSRGKVRIIDRPGLEAMSCECYAVVRARFERLLPQPA